MNRGHAVILALLSACEPVSERTRDDVSALLTSPHAVYCEPPAGTDDSYLCYDTRANCEGGAHVRSHSCLESNRPRWHCGRTLDQTTGELHTDICWPTKAMCEASHHAAADRGTEPCRAVATVYCRSMDSGAIACHPEREHCAQIQRKLGEMLRRVPAPCVRR